MTQGLSVMAHDDAEAAHNLHARCFPPHETWSVGAFRESLCEPSTLGLAWQLDTRLDGMILLQRVRPDAEILTLAVDPDARRQGLASALLQGARTLLGPYGIDRILLDVAADNHVAIQFYENSGFHEDGRRKNYYLRSGGEHVDAILMSRQLAGHGTESEA